MMKRAWQNWDVGGVAETIEGYWQNDPLEAAHRVELTELVSRYIIHPQSSVLEVGCGTGLVYERLVPSLVANDKYVGVDVSEKMLAIARRKFPQGTFLPGDGYELEFETGAFQLTLCFEVLGHIQRIKKFLTELLRVTNRICLFTVWPSQGDDIIENRENIDDTEFLHRQYSEAFIRRAIHGAESKLVAQVEVLQLSRGHRAYVVHLNRALRGCLA